MLNDKGISIDINIYLNKIFNQILILCLYILLTMLIL